MREFTVHFRGIKGEWEYEDELLGQFHDGYEREKFSAYQRKEIKRLLDNIIKVLEEEPKDDEEMGELNNK